MNDSHINIIVMCDNYYTAIAAYRGWLTYLEAVEPGWVQEYSEASLSVTTDETLRYIFCDWRMIDVLQNIADVVIDIEEFIMIEDACRPYYEEQIKGVIYND